MDFPIDDALDNQILAEIIDTYSLGLSTSDTPQFYLVIGQPGAGKTEVILRIKTLLNDNVLECNADTLRNFHPDINTILADHEEEYVELTWPAAERWNKALIEEGVRRKLNIVIETTGRDKDLILATLKQKKALGYTTHLHVMAIPKPVSWVGVRVRYESMKSHSSYGRAVTDEILEDRCNRLLENLPFILDSPDLDHVDILSRTPLLSPEMNSALTVLSSERETSMNVFINTFQKKMDISTKASFLEACQRILYYMKQRNASAEEIAAFNELADIKSGE